MANMVGSEGISNYSSSPTNLVLQLRGLYNSPLWPSFEYLYTKIGHYGVRDAVGLFKQYGNPSGLAFTQLGKLHAKEEAAGKVRIFAIVDPWTQYVLYPIHMGLFGILKDIPMDGTFDQPRPLSNINGSRGLYSLDLTAATDRMPLEIQVHLLGELIGDQEFAAHWAKLLVDRDYNFFQLGYSPYHGNYRYAVGQPMGAYSSWASLAVTHHLLVQCAAWSCGFVPLGTLYTNYAILGDDLVIGDPEVKAAYLALLKELGMEVNIHKSIISDTGNCLEFAKRTIWKGQDVSPISVKEMGSAQALLPSLVNFMAKYDLSLVELLQAFGFGWRTLTWLTKPLGKLSAQIRAIVLGISITKDPAELSKFFTLGSPVHRPYLPDRVRLNTMFMLSDVTKTGYQAERLLKRAKEAIFGLTSPSVELSKSLIATEAVKAAERGWTLPADYADKMLPSYVELIDRL